MHIATLEDDATQARLIQSLLAKAGHQCTLFGTGKDMLAGLARDHRFDLLILDWEVPDISGLDVLRWARANLSQALPIMFVTSRAREEDLVVGLRAGADDYMVKPVREGELVARVAALQRRAAPEHPMKTSFSCAAYEIDLTAETISLNGEIVELARKEYELALLFFRNTGRLFTRDALGSSVWNREILATSRTLDTHLSNIRRKLRMRPENGVRLSSLYALGYRLDLLTGTQESTGL